MYNQGVTELGRWVVKDYSGEVIKRFNTQAQAIDFANRAQKAQKVIVLIDVASTEIQLIERSVREVLAS